MISGPESPERLTGGIDVSRWQPPDRLDYQAIAAEGFKYAAIRCTVGDYYYDPAFPAHWENFGNAGMLRMPYLVAAPAETDGGRRISTGQHMQHFINSFGDREAELPWVVDAELTRGQSRAYVTELILGIVEAVEAFIGRYPIIYTRETWWDPTVYADPLWSNCPLWAARYNTRITGPWSDGYCVFRDWSSWHFWQWTKNGTIPNYTGSVDLDHFNGELDDLVLFSGNLTQKTMLKVLWREAQAAGWKLEP